MKSGQYNDTDSPSMPLSQCDFSLGGPETGELIRELLQLGFSQPWPEALEAMTGRKDMSAESFIKYFLPLFDFLVEENQGVCIGWSGKWKMAMKIQQF